MLTMQMFEEAFSSAWAKESNYLGVLISINGNLEVIINHKDNYEQKLEYYKTTYNEILEHKHASGIKIIDFTFEENYAGIEMNLLEAQ